MNIVLIVFANLCCRSIARNVVPLFFDMFLEKNKLKDDSNNDADWVHDLRIILIAAHKNYHYCRMLLTRHYDQRPFDETVCDAIITNGG